jgi:hypothetical protein
VKLRYSSTASYATDGYVNGDFNGESHGRVDYALKAGVTLRRVRGRSWVGKGRLRWTSVRRFEGRDCYNAAPNIVLDRKRNSTFRVSARLRFRHGRLVSAALRADPGNPRIRVERNLLVTADPDFCSGRDAWWSTYPESFPPGWRAMFSRRHFGEPARRPPEDPAGKECYDRGPRCDTFSTQLYIRRPPRLIIRKWKYRSSGAVLATKRYPRRGWFAPNNVFKIELGDSWRLIRTR